ncbi:hypothetical protein [Reyranella soli]|uniref:hypothetical protein n=1 Tax=Reyranella soli TaxID=1230389 RepID=UPI0011BE31E0|nr:hypothetical protein [Reyranella soli]
MTTTVPPRTFADPEPAGLELAVTASNADMPPSSTIRRPGCAIAPRWPAPLRSAVRSDCRRRLAAAGEHFSIASLCEEAGYLLFHFPAWAKVRVG